MTPMLHVGLTGGLASGKSTVARIVADLGAVVVDADKIARDVVGPGTPGLEAVVGAFGAEVLQPDSSLDREALASVVFDDDAALRALNAIVHPLVREQTAMRVARLPEDTIVVHDVPLIVENDMGAQFHLVVVVGASVGVRTQRAVDRGMSESAAVARIAHQAQDRARRLAADVWLDNERDPENLRAVVELLWRARIEPFADNLAAGRWAEPGEVDGAPATENVWQEQADRLVARIQRVAGDRLERVRHTPTADATLDVIELSAEAPAGELPPDALMDAGFVPAGAQEYANADPGRPAVLRLTRTGDGV